MEDDRIKIGTQVKRGSAELAILSVLGRAAARLPNRQMHRAPDARLAALQSRLALSAALSHGEARLGEGDLGRCPRRAPQALLPLGPCGQTAPGSSSRGVGAVVSSFESSGWGEPCLTGERS